MAGAPTALEKSRQTTASITKKVWMRISTPIQRPNGIDQPRIHIDCSHCAHGEGIAGDFCLVFWRFRGAGKLGRNDGV
jgi:hypothetical protein